MTIEIHEPELEALIAQRMESGAYKSVEEALLQALRSAPPSHLVPSAKGLTGADLIAVLQTFPYPEIDIAPERFPMPVRDPEVL